MKTNQFKTRIQYCIFLLTLSFIIFNCTHENIENENSERYTTVEISKTLDFLNKKNTTDTKNLSRSNSNFINEIDDANITLESISNTDAKLTIIPAKTGFDNHFSRIVALNIDGEIKTNIVHSYPNENSNDEKFSGEIIVTDLNGIFITGFRINNGLIISKYLKNNNETLASRSSSNDDNCRNECGHSPSNGSCICNMQFTDEVVIVSQNPWQYVSISTIYPQDGGGDVDTCEIGCYGWDIVVVAQADQVM
jgi:hypothetical protein